MNIETINYFLQCWVGIGAFVFLVACLLIGVPTHYTGNRAIRLFSVTETLLVAAASVAGWPLLVVGLLLESDTFNL